MSPAGRRPSLDRRVPPVWGRSPGCHSPPAPASAPEDRIQSAHDVELHLEWAGAPVSGTVAGGGGSVLAWIVAGVAVVAALAVVAWGVLGRRDAIGPVAAALAPPPGVAFSTGWANPIAISPDGSHVAFVAHADNGPDRLWVRPMGAVEAHELPGTEGAIYPFFSPDSRVIGFFTESEMRRVDVAGGPVTKITDCNDARGATWGSKNLILFAPRGLGGLVVVDANGGVPRPVTQLDTTLHEVTHRYPYFLPDGEHYLYLARGRG